MTAGRLFSLLIFSGCIILLSADGESLYSSKDDVVLLDNDNFSSHVHGSKTAWLVEFYSSWCGHCIRFAPTFKDFATKVKGWKDVIQIGVLDCANDKNIPACRTYQIGGYPTLKFFEPNAKNTSIGKERESMLKSIPNIMKDTANFAAKQPDLKSKFPTIISGQEASVFSDHPDSQLAVFLNTDKYTYGASLFLQLNKNLSDLNVPIYLSSKDSIKAGIIKKGEKIVKTLAIKGNDLDEDAETIMKQVSAGKDAGPSAEKDAGDVKRRRYTVFMSDLENAIMYSLKHEVASHAMISGDKLSTFQTFLETLFKYFPGRKVTREFLRELKAWVFSHNDVIKGEELEKHIGELTQRLGAFRDTPKGWNGCKGSSNRYGGYPCSLWTLFHTLTVSHAGVTSDSVSTRLDVLNTMRVYIKEYFGCRDCARHFEQEWLNDTPSKTVSKAEDAIVWLWRTHNKVNVRLSGDLSDDPSFPKQKFPDAQHCGLCYVDNGSKTGDNLTQGYDLRQILVFLRELYGRNISYEGLSKDMEPAQTSHDDRRPSFNDHVRKESLFNKKSSGFWFSSLDMSLLFFFYLTAIILIFCVCKKLLFKRRCKILNGASYISHKV